MHLLFGKYLPFFDSRTRLEPFDCDYCGGWKCELPSGFLRVAVSLSEERYELHLVGEEEQFAFFREILVEMLLANTLLVLPPFCLN